MAKVGSKEEGAYDPFNRISNSLSALVEESPGEMESSKTKGEQAASLPSSVGITEESSSHVESEPILEQGERGRMPPIPRRVSAANSLTVVKRFMSTRDEAARLDRATANLGAKLGLTLDISKLTRALWHAYLSHEEDILRNVPEDEVWERPANYDTVGMAELDERLGKLINDGLMVASRRPKNTR